MTLEPELVLVDFSVIVGEPVEEEATGSASLLSPRRRGRRDPRSFQGAPSCDVDYDGDHDSDGDGHQDSRPRSRPSGLPAVVATLVFASAGAAAVLACAGALLLGRRQGYSLLTWIGGSAGSVSEQAPPGGRPVDREVVRPRSRSTRACATQARHALPFRMLTSASPARPGFRNTYHAVQEVWRLVVCRSRLGRA